MVIVQERLNHLEIPTKNDPNIVCGVPERLKARTNRHDTYKAKKIRHQDTRTGAGSQEKGNPILTPDFCLLSFVSWWRSVRRN